MKWTTVLFLVAVYMGPLVGAVTGAASVSARRPALRGPVGAGIAVTLLFTFLSVTCLPLGNVIFWTAPLAGAAVAFLIARWVG